MDRPADHLDFFLLEVGGFALEADADFAPLIFAGKEVACFRASATHRSTALWSALPSARMAKIPRIGLEGMKSQSRACGL